MLPALPDWSWLFCRAPATDGSLTHGTSSPGSLGQEWHSRPGCTQRGSSCSAQPQLSPAMPVPVPPPCGRGSWQPHAYCQRGAGVALTWLPEAGARLQAPAAPSCLCCLRCRSGCAAAAGGYVRKPRRRAPAPSPRRLQAGGEEQQPLAARQALMALPAAAAGGRWVPEQWEDAGGRSPFGHRANRGDKPLSPSPSPQLQSPRGWGH